MRKECDFSKGKRASEVPALVKLQAENAGKERITIRIDADVLAYFRAQVAKGGNYQTTINDVLRLHVQEREGVLERTLRRVIREELSAA
jgi:uncharacterized protein (DUF4415 family)